jgi:hypothetical protein
VTRLDPPGGAEVGATVQRVPAIAFAKSDRFAALVAGDAYGDAAIVVVQEDDIAPGLRFSRCDARIHRFGGRLSSTASTTPTTRGRSIGALSPARSEASHQHHRDPPRVH